MIDLKAFKVANVPDSVYYVPEFITDEEENLIMKQVYNEPKPKWTYLKNRRLQNHGGVPHPNGMIVEEIPIWLQKFVDKVAMLDIFKNCMPNHVLVNEYLPGQGIMAHLDGPLFYPTVSTISCGSHTILTFSTNDSTRDKICELLLERRSLVVLQDDMYKKYLHSISEVTADVLSTDLANLTLCKGKYGHEQILNRSTRISLTIRNVPKICKLNISHLLKK